MTEFYVLLNHRPARIPVLQQAPEKRRKINVAIANDRKNLVLDSLFERPLLPPSLLEHLTVAILEVHKAKFALEFLGFFHRVPVAVQAVTGVET